MKRKWLALLLAMFLFALGAGDRPTLTPGIYAVKPEKGWDRVVFGKGERHRQPVKYFISEQTKDLRLDLPKERFASFSFSHFPLGNAGTEYTLVVGSQNRYFFDTLYIDLNRDGVISPQEEIKMHERQNIALGYTVQELEAETSLNVTYRTSTGKHVEHPLDIRLTFYYGKFSDEPVIFYMIQNDTFLQGTGLSGGKPMIFAVVDGNGNGNYNDLGEDLFFYDKNGDGKFQYSKESQILKALHNLKVGRGNCIYRFIAPVFPGKIGLIDADSGYSMIDFE